MFAMNARPGKRASVPPSLLSHRWYLPEWGAYFGKIQADAQRELGWPRAKTSDLWNGKQRYTQETVDEVSRWFGIDPFELLMPPAEAVAMRQFRSAARTIAGQEALPPPSSLPQGFNSPARTSPRSAKPLKT